MLDLTHLSDPIHLPLRRLLHHFLTAQIRAQTQLRYVANLRVKKRLEIGFPGAHILIAMLSVSVQGATPASAGSSEHAAAGTPQPHIADSPQQQHQQQEQQAAAVQPDQQQQQLPQQAGSSLHQQVLFEMPPPGQPLPPLPRFRPRKPEQQPVPILEALRFVQVMLMFSSVLL